MFVKSIMIPRHRCITVQYEDNLAVALTKMEEYDIESLPVIKDERYEGVITRFGIYEDFFHSSMSKDEFLEQTKAGEAARRKDVYFKGEEVFENALLTLKSFPLAPVIDESNKLLGIVTRFDVLDQFRSAFGVGKSGVRIAVACIEAEGQIAKIADLSKSYHDNIISLSTFDETDKLMRRIVIKVEKNKNMDKFIHKLETAGFKVLDIQED
ncbi:CBS domain-containing protein [Bacillus sp. 165]|uniref:CBS domain-containing protein n=1 Tax=Bacillus sp. 165 TaxID=1529117 RepID=UPI001ADCCF20|nr:CBS domain-containing protein [Bacillus sp. 165]MBO9128272.1 CBS domain-containing protein [Bacillus sp. 165]